MLIGFGAIVSILMFGGFLEPTSASILEDVIVDKDHTNVGDSKKDAKEIRTVGQGAHFYSLEG